MKLSTLIEQFDRQQVLNALRSIDIDLSNEKFNIDDIVDGANVEIEHDKDPALDVEEDALVDSVKIALTHLRERPDYYLLLKKYVEKE